jgi:hypothetical protein
MTAQIGSQYASDISKTSDLRIPQMTVEWKTVDEQQWDAGSGVRVCHVEIVNWKLHGYLLMQIKDLL